MAQFGGELVFVDHGDVVVGGVLFGFWREFGFADAEYLA